MSEALEYVIRIRGGPESAAQVRLVESAVRSTGGSMKTLGKESELAGTKLGKATSGVRALGKGLIAAGAGFLAWEAGKKSLDFTEELLKSTKQLEHVGGLTTAEASRWAGVTSAVGGNAQQSAMAFQKIANAAEKQVISTQKQIAAGKVANSTIIAGTEPLEKLGLSTAFLEKHQHNLAPVMEAVVDRIGKGNNVIKDSSTLTNLFGRGWKQLSPLLLEGKKHLDDLLGTAKEMGVELKGNAGQALEELREKQIRASLASEGLRLRFTEIAAKPLGDLLQGFSALSIAIQKNEWGKFDKQAVKIGQTFTKIAEVILPHVAETFGHMAPIVLKGFANGFTHASIGGQLVIAGLILTKLGLTKSIFTGLAASSANLFLAPFGLKVRGGVVKAVEKSAVVTGAEEGAFAGAGGEAGAAFSGGFAAALTGAAAIALGYSAASVAKTAFGGNNAEPFGGGIFPKSSEKNRHPKKEREALAKQKQQGETVLLPNGEEIKEVEGKVVERKHAGKTVKSARAKELTERERGEGRFAKKASAHDSAEVKDLHLYADGRKILQVNARQIQLAQAAGE